MTEVDSLEVLQPTAQTKTYEVSGYILEQKPLTFFGKMEFFSVLGGALEKALSDVSLGEILDVPLEGGINASNFSDTDAFLKAIATLVQYAPEFLKETFLIALAVPRDQREAVSEAFDELTDDQGAEILETFIDQNWQAMLDFFNARISPLLDKVMGNTQKLAPSKPSKRSRASTVAA